MKSLGKQNVEMRYYRNGILNLTETENRVVYVDNSGEHWISSGGSKRGRKVELINGAYICEWRIQMVAKKLPFITAGG